MASIRRLKKDIDYLTDAIIDDSLNCLAYGKDVDDISKIVEEALRVKGELRQRVNSGRKVKKEEKKTYYQTIRKELWTSVHSTYSMMSDVVKQD